MKRATRDKGMVLLEEIFSAMDLALTSPDMIKVLADCGLTSDDIFCNANEQGSCLMKIPCFVLPGESSNWYTKPIEGLFALVDLNTKLKVGARSCGHGCCAN